MDAFTLFMAFCFLVYLQASIYVFWSSPFVGINNWFSLITLLFSVWSLAYVFSGMGEAAGVVFPPVAVTLTGLAFVPAFYTRIFSSLFRKPSNMIVRNGLFIGWLIVGLAVVALFITRDAVIGFEPFDLFADGHTLIPLHAGFLALNAFLYTRLHYQILNPARIVNEIHDATPMIILLCDASFRVVYANKFALDTLGRSDADLLGESFWSVVAGGGEARELHEPFSEHQQDSTFKCHFLTGHGTRLEVQLDMIKVTDIFQDQHGFAMTGQVTGVKPDYLERIKTCELELKQVQDDIEQTKAVIQQHSMKLAEIRQMHAENISAYLKSDELVLTDIDEREILIGEVHNRVISNMQLMISIIGLYLSDHHPAGITEKIKNLSQRVHTMLLLHRHLYFSMQYADVDFKAFLYQLIGELSATHDPSKQVNIHLQVSESFMDIGKAIPLGLIINELIINSYRHAFVYGADEQVSDDDPLIEITLSGDSEGFVLIMKDNGRGLPFSYRHYADAYGGLSLVDLLVRDQIGGFIRVAGEQGLEVRIDFSVASEPD